MEMNKNLTLVVGDWVRGKTRNGALVHGYLESIQSKNSKVALKVVVSDNERIIGNTVHFEQKDIEKIDNSVKTSEKQLEDLIDFALATKDHNWFMELSAELKNLKQNEKFSTNRNNDLNSNYKKLRNRSY
ncbi:IDEAL domain-containing protein [Aquibacillus saliphilus]|uniref:IDEAL domain-containing protein n=1 Tax=Aquibacillus saliphilus TaxID=1909422 RepID=UPI001CF04F11|nr:IDEAL domain-containing protein [Aquibacillus saliphilus]